MMFVYVCVTGIVNDCICMQEHAGTNFHCKSYQNVCRWYFVRNTGNGGPPICRANRNFSPTRTIPTMMFKLHPYRRSIRSPAAWRPFFCEEDLHRARHCHPERQAHLVDSDEMIMQIGSDWTCSETSVFKCFQITTFQADIEDLSS